MSRRAFLYPLSIWNQLNRTHHGVPFWGPRPFGLDPTTPEEFFKAASALMNSAMPSFFDYRYNAPRYAVVTPKTDKKGFEVKVDVNGYSPEELEVKTVDNCIVVEGKHEEKPDEEGFVSRTFLRRYVLPDSVKPETVNCSLSSDGYLVLSAPLPVEDQKVNERQIPIMMSSEPAGDTETESSAKQEKVKAGAKE